MNLQFNIGDLVTTYYSGFYRVTKIVRRWENKKYPEGSFNAIACNIAGEFDPDTCGRETNPLVYFKQEYTADGRPIKSNIIKYCDGSFVQPASVDLKKFIKYHKESVVRLNSILEKEYSNADKIPKNLSST